MQSIGPIYNLSDLQWNTRDHELRTVNLFGFNFKEKRGAKFSFAVDRQSTTILLAEIRVDFQTNEKNVRSGYVNVGRLNVEILPRITISLRDCGKNFPPNGMTQFKHEVCALIAREGSLSVTYHEGKLHFSLELPHCGKEVTVDLLEGTLDATALTRFIQPT